MPTIVLSILAAIMNNLPEIESAAEALFHLAQGTPLTAPQQQALGKAMEQAHNSLQAAVSSPVPLGVVDGPALVPVPAAA